MNDQRTILAGQLLELLWQQGGQTKYQLKQRLQARAIHATKTEINSVLYSFSLLFKRDDSSLPRWWAAVEPAAIGSVAWQPTVVQPLSRHPTPGLYKGPRPRDWQLEAFQAWRNAGYRGIVEAVTGTGKTAVGILAAAAAAEQGLDTLILVPGTDLMEQWFEKLSGQLPDLEIGRLGGRSRDEFEHCHVLVATVQSACRRQIPLTTEGGLLVADEVHRYGADAYSRALDARFTWRMGLTATYERDDFGLENYLRPYFGPQARVNLNRDEVVAGCSYPRGLEDGILAPFRVAMVAVSLPSDEFEVYTTLDKTVRKLRGELIGSHGCPREPFGEFMKAVTVLSEGNNGDPIGTSRSRIYLNAFTQRRALLANSGHKLNAAAKLRDIFAAAGGSLIFTETVESAQTAAATLQRLGIAALDYTSQLNNSRRKERLEWFRARQIRVLAAPRVLDEGIDVPEADVGVIVAASRSRRQMVQRMGRIIRPKSGGRLATFFVLFAQGTSEDPELGAHEDFLGEMLDTAESLDRFKADVTGAELFEWYLS